MKITWALKSNSRAFLLAGMLAPAAFWLWPFNAGAQMPELRLPRSQGHVNDLAGVIDQATKQQLENILANLQQRTGINFVIATIKTAGDQDLYDYSVRVASDWDVGSQTNKQKSLLLLLATDKARSFTLSSRSVRPDLPYGLFDEMARSTRPQFQRSDFGGGLLAGVQTFVSMLGERRSFTFAAMDQTSAKLEAASQTRPRQAKSEPSPRNTTTNKPLAPAPQSDVYLDSRQRSEASVSPAKFLFPASATPPQRPTTAQVGVTLSGIVEDPAGAVIPGEQLTLVNKATSETRHATSDGTGKFSFKNVMPGEYGLRVEAEGVKPITLVVAVGAKPVAGLIVKMKKSISEQVTVTKRESERPDAVENHADKIRFGAGLGRSSSAQSQEVLPVLTNFRSPTAQGTVQGGITLNGTLEDPAGAVIPGGQLTLTNKTTGAARHAVSDGSGNFNLKSVMPGEYVLKGEMEGFKSTELAVTVGAEPLAALKLKMEISVSEEVTIIAGESRQPSAPENNANAVTLNMNWLGSLPSQGQDILPVLGNFLSPAAQGVNGPSIVVDGMEASALDVPTNAIRQVAINKNPYSAEFRRPGLSRIDIITRNGSHGRYDGSVAFFVRNSALDARNAFATEKPRLDRRLFEATLSGPVALVKHTRFFFSGGRLANSEDVVVNALTLTGPFIQNVPTARHNTNLLGRIDVRPNSLNAVTLTYNFHDQPERNLRVGGLRLPEQGISGNDRVHKFTFSENAILSDSFINTFRFSFERRSRHLGNRTDRPQIEVRGAFTGGPSQTARSEQESRAEFQDVASKTIGSQTLRFGGAFRPRFFDFSDATNFGGTFIFSNLADFAAGTPTLFQVVQGNPNVSFSQPEAYGFLQDEINLSSHLNLMLGLRYEWQAKVHDRNNFAPRVALAYAPGNQKTVLRVGTGIFYDQLPRTAIERSLLINGARTRELVIARPSFPDPFQPGAVSSLPSVWRIAPDLREPYLIQSSLSLERRLWGTVQATIEYQNIRGVHLFRSRNINAPLDSSGTRPDSNFLLIRQIESSASLRSNALIATLQGSFTKFFKGRVQYTLSRTTDDTDGIFDLPANNFDLLPERGRAIFDRRHRLNFAGTFNLPRSFRLGSVLIINSAGPFDITTGFDNNGDRIVNDRPAGVTRNRGRGPAFAQLDLRFSRLFQAPVLFQKKVKPGRELRNLDFSLDIFNVFNHTNLTDIIGDESSPRFGRASTALQPRTLQLSFKYNF